jgi:serine/threonine-protein kinase HipA
MQRELEVYIDLDGSPVLAGRLWARERAGKETCSFTYAKSWLERRGAFALAPTLMLSPAQFHANKALFGIFDDSAPDSWGRKLMRRYERTRASEAGRAPRTLFHVDFLAGVDDRARMGALRYKDPEGNAFLTTSKDPLPPLLDLPRLLGASDKIDRGRESDADVRLVLAPGTSLGGARPKATVRDKDQRLLVAKFPKRDDEWPVIRWEATALTLAKMAGISVPSFALHSVARKPVLILDRFDRTPERERVHFMSAMTALDATDHGEQRSYLELVDVLRQSGASPVADLIELWRRMVFNILVSNTDDHLRNHGFLHEAGGWRLSPAYDLNPVPVEIKPRVQALAIDEIDGSSSLETAFSVASSFGLKKNEAVALAAEIGSATAKWRQTGKSFGLKPADAEFMLSAFEHADLKLALASQTKSAGAGKVKEAKSAGKKNAAKSALPSRRSSRQRAKKSSGRQAETRS